MVTNLQFLVGPTFAGHLGDSQFGDGIDYLLLYNESSPKLSGLKQPVLCHCFWRLGLWTWLPGPPDSGLSHGCCPDADRGCDLMSASAWTEVMSMFTWVVGKCHFSQAVGLRLRVLTGG